MVSENTLITNLVPQGKLRTCIILAFLAGIMLFVRIILVYSKVFTDWPGEYGNFVNFAADDAVYHMRLVHNTIQHFPYRIFFDPSTYCPFGSYISFGPLFTLIIASTALIIGLGSPSPELINHVGAYIPPVMGALCLIPVYLATNKLFGRTVAFLAALVLTFTPGEFLSRSALGFTDHHIAEVLFSAITCTLLIYTLSIATEIKNAAHNKTFLLYGLFTGLAYGLFVLTWHGAQMLGIIFLLFSIIQLIIGHYKNSDVNYLLPLVYLVCLPPVIMVLPYVAMHPHFNLTLYPLYIVFILPTLAAIFTICYLAHLLCKKNPKLKIWYIPVLLIIFTILILLLRHCFPQVRDFISYGCKFLFRPTAGMNTVGEVQSSLFDSQGKITSHKFWLNMFWATPLAIIGSYCLVYRIYKYQRPTEVFLFIWSLAIFIAACAQIRFNYMLTINSAIVAGFGIYSILNYIGSFTPKSKFLTWLQKFSFGIVFIICAFLIIDPIIMLWIDNLVPSGIHVTREWYDTMQWLKKHTPDPQGKPISANFDYKSGYYPIPKDLKAVYNYPKSAYGIMSWWDIGHQITYIAERIPNANNHQQGIIENNHTAGSALFFTSGSEKHAVQNLVDMKSRYIIITNEMATNKFYGMIIWCNDTKDWNNNVDFKTKIAKKTYKFKGVPIDSPKFLHSMTNRLFYNDTSGLKHFRLIHESNGDYKITARKITLKPRVIAGSVTSNYSTYQAALKDFKKINNIVSNKKQTVFAYHARPPVKEIKIFEKVAGATIKGDDLSNNPNATLVTLVLKLKTKYNRVFNYIQTTKITNGKYQFIVPYPTTKMQGEDYSYDIKPMGNYQIKIKNRTYTVKVPESAVMQGKIINVN